MVALPAADVELLQRDKRFDDWTPRRGVCPPNGVFIPDISSFIFKTKRNTNAELEVIIPMPNSI